MEERSLNAFDTVIKGLNQNRYSVQSLGENFVLKNLYSCRDILIATEEKELSN